MIAIRRLPFQFSQARALQRQYCCSSTRKLDGKVAIVTAATEGIGFAIAKRLAADGACVSLCSRKEANVASAIEELKNEGFKNVMGMKCHVSDEEQRKQLVNKTVDTFGGIDFLVHCAGINPPGKKLFDISSEDFDKVIDVNLKSPWEMAKLVRPHLKKRKGSSIVLLSTGAAYLGVPLNLGMYSVSKMALIVMAKEMARVLGEDNIRVNSIAAGLISTKFSQFVRDDEEQTRIIFDHLMLKRYGECSEVASVASFLCSDDASYVTGDTIVVAGTSAGRL